MFVNLTKALLLLKKMANGGGYINTKGEQAIECKFDGAGYFNEGFAVVKKDGKWGDI